MKPLTESSELIAELFAIDGTEARYGQTLHGREGETLSDRRGGARTVAGRPWTVIPMLADGRPDLAHRTAGHSLVLNAQGIGLECDVLEWRWPAAFAIGVRNDHGVMEYAGVEVCHTTNLAAGRVRIGGKFAGRAHDLIQPQVLTPTYHPETMTFRLPFADELYQAWQEAGVLQAVWLDRVQLCPRCQGLPTFRPGCRCCGSARVRNDRLIHHFACAHVGLVADFETPDGLACPKCRTDCLVIGSDYEYHAGPHHCLDCHWTESELEQVGQCVRCGLRFPGHQAHVLELTGYHVDRLDPLAFLQAP
ncbi:MAG TPA: hypothetical protein VKI65_09705 [Gemmataceae bacterium]|nr:hypothetical protein [Gemmataceae bacterium]